MKRRWCPAGPREWHQHDIPSLTVQSLASWWVGVCGDEDRMELGTISDLLGIDYETHRSCPRSCQDSNHVLKFALRSSTEKQLQIRTECYPNSLPVAVGKAVLGLVETMMLFRCLGANILIQTAILNDLPGGPGESEEDDDED